MIPRNKEGKAFPLAEAETGLAQRIDGTAGAVSSARLPESIYRLAVESSVADAGVHITIIDFGGGVATATTGIYMPHGSVEYIPIPEGKYISVIDGILNIVPFH